MSRRMLGASHKDAAITKAACHCGRRQCSAMRKDLRRTQRRIEAQAVRREIEAQR